jgi:glycosyltransferase involved in cell wall biosynthesis
MIKISLCMIVKNEESSLGECLNSISEHMDEIIIVDTGSSDRTREIAQRYTDKVYNYIWKDDFSAARNFSISKTSNEYVLILDADEIVKTIDIREVKRLVEMNPFKIGRVLRVNEYVRKENEYKFTERVNRLFSKEIYHYEGIIHEQVIILNNEKRDLCKTVDDVYTDDTFNIPISLVHGGYDGDLKTRSKKTNRNKRLLKNMLLKNPNDPYLLYQLGKSYYMEEEYNAASKHFTQALYMDLNPKLEYVQDMVESYGYSLLNSGKYEEALLMLNIYDEFSHSADFLFLMALILMNNGKLDEAIQEFSKAAQRPHAKMEGVNGYLSYYNIGVINECLGMERDAKYFYSQCGDYEPAKVRLGKININNIH